VAAKIQDISALTSIDDIANALGAAEMLLDFARQAIKLCELRMFDWIKKNPGKELAWPIDAEGHTRRFYIGKETKTAQLVPSHQILKDLLAVGDVERISDCLASNAWKHGAMNKYLQELKQTELYAKFFKKVVVEKLDAKTGEPAGPKLIEINDKFLDR
jgi:hypothetical protein